MKMPENHEWTDLTKTALGLAHDVGAEKKTDNFASSMKRIDEQLSDMKRSRAEYERLLSNGRASTASASFGPDDYLKAVSKFESVNDPGAVNERSGAAGRFQFMPGTWRTLMSEAPHLGLTPEGITNDDQQYKAMKYYTGKSAALMRPLLGRDPTGGELYLAHLLGHSGGPAVLKNLDAPITSTIDPAAYRANPFLANYKTGNDLVAGLNYQFGGGPRPARTTSEETGATD